MTPRRRLRCCGKFCYWQVPVGPWACPTCYRTFDGPMPRNALHRFFDFADERAAVVRPWTERERDFFRACFGPLMTLPAKDIYGG